jgi:WD40 repeat protein
MNNNNSLYMYKNTLTREVKAGTCHSCETDERFEIMNVTNGDGHVSRPREAGCSFCAAIPGHAAVYDACLLPGEQGVICATADNNIYVLALGTGRGADWIDGDHVGFEEPGGRVKMVLEGHEDMVTTLALSPDGQQLLSGSLDKTVCVWDLGSVQELGQVAGQYASVKRDERDSPGRLAPRATLEGHANRINCLRWTPCGSAAISSSTDSTLRLWDITSGICLSEMKGHGSLVSSIDISKDGTICASASGDTVCKLWGILAANSDCGRVQPLPFRAELIDDIAWESGPVVLCQFLEYAAHGEYLLTAHAQLVQQQARILLWDVFDRESGWVDGRLRAPCYAIDDLRGCPTSMDAVHVQGGEFAGTVLLACACSDGKVHLWDVEESPIKMGTFSLEEAGYSAPKDLPAWSIGHLRHAANRLNKVSFSPSGTYLAATRSDSSSIIVWDVDEGEEAQHFHGHTKPIRRLLWISDYMLISFSEDGTVRGWSIVDADDKSVVVE